MVDRELLPSVTNALWSLAQCRKAGNAARLRARNLMVRILIAQKQQQLHPTLAATLRSCDLVELTTISRALDHASSTVSCCGRPLPRHSEIAAVARDDLPPLDWPDSQGATTETEGD